MAESALNDTRVIRPRELGGYGLDSQWNDDFHHALRVLLGGDRDGYYQDFGELEQLARAFRDGFVYAGEYSPFRRRRHGNSSRQRPAQQFIVFAENHDQVGNRLFGERLSQSLSLEALKLAASAVLLSPFIPLLFMGEEYGEVAPFQYFISHLEPELVEAVRRGRRQEFAAFAWQGEPPDPQDVATFERAKLNHHLRLEGHHRALYEFYQELIRLRKALPALAQLSKEHMHVVGYEREKILCLRRWCDEQQVWLILHFGNTPATLRLLWEVGLWHKQLDSAELRWGGPGSAVDSALTSEGEVGLALAPQSCLVFAQSAES
jgi:maltooligosyltrehalose trehalohydrolase